MLIYRPSKIHQDCQIAPVFVRTSGSKAWNVDADGRHVDFTIMDTDQYTYLGVVIPWPLISEIAFSTMAEWYTFLPYLTYGR